VPVWWRWWRGTSHRGLASRALRRPPPAHIHFEVRHPDAAGLLTELLFAGDPWLGGDAPGEIVRPTELAGSDPPALHARFDIVLQPG